MKIFFFCLLPGIVLLGMVIDYCKTWNQAKKNDLEFKNQEWKRMCQRLERVEKELSESKRHEMAWRHQYAVTAKELDRVRLQIRLRN